MKNERKSEIKVGLTTFTALIVFLIILGWTKDFDFIDDKIKILVEFENVAGLGVGDAVMIKGVKRGKVSEIEITDSRVITHLSMNKEAVLWDDATFSIMMLDLMGGKKIEINPGSMGEFIPEKVYQGKFLGDISTAMAMLSSVQNDLIGMTKELRITLEKTNEILTDNDFKENLRGSVANLKDITSRLNLFMVKNENSLSSLITNSNTLITSADDLITNNESKLKGFIERSEELISNSNELVLKLNLFIQKVENKENNLGKMVYDPELLNDFTEAMLRVRELTELLINQLKNEGLNIDLF
ncbi:MAG: MCE family protein [Bacteroidetes bacterium]|nr:MCE family protein [Bacteroidota bacterium]